jgi:hypothetical protein
MNGWQDSSTAPYTTWVLAWLYLPKNPPASGPVIAQRCSEIEKDDPEGWEVEIRQTIGCWWANGRYYPTGMITHWMQLPEPPQ